MYSPKFIITNKILKNISIIEACREIITHAPLLPYYEKKFQNEALVRTIHHGTHIEGNELNLTQAEKIVMGQTVIARERDIQEIINYRKVMDFIDQRRSQSIEGKSQEITEQDIFHMHKLTVDKILPSETSGIYRRTQVVIKNSHTGEVSFRPALAINVPSDMKQLINFINQTTSEDIHTILKSAITHYEFVRIHPFVDGNGRVARALSTLILFEENYDIRKFFSLEEYFDSNAAQYYESLQSVTYLSGELTNWLEYFTEGLSIELNKIKERVENVSIDAQLRQKLGGKPLMLSDRQLKIIEYIQKTGYLENKGFKSLFPMVSEDTILNELKILIQNNIVKKHGVTKSSKYIMM